MINETKSRQLLDSYGWMGNTYHTLDHSNIKEHNMAKEKAIKVSETKSTELLKVPAYSDSKLVGWAQVTVFKLSDAGLAAAKAKLTQSDVADLNRQKVTDAKNNLRRGTSIIATLRALTKTNPKVEQLVEVILRKAEAGELTDDFLKSIGA